CAVSSIALAMGSVGQVTHGSLADIPFNADVAPEDVVLSRKTPDGGWTDVTAAEFAGQLLE
ncbi:hypothetical protein, partial [Serratia marcescens]|uniref:hypothetical protein n=1 Tax=Serratia marcescens TaxID=615 RepID=UPI0013DAD36E